MQLSTLSLLGSMLGTTGPRAAGPARRSLSLCLCGDVMPARGIDQILPHPGDPTLYESYARSALDYVELAERANGPVQRPVAFDYPWGDALTVVRRLRPDAWIANLETAVSDRGEPAAKGIHYRMHPKNIDCLRAVPVDCWSLANNHVLDWGRVGLYDTLDTLRAHGLRAAGAGRSRAEAEAPAVVPLERGGRVLVFAFGSVTSGIPLRWAASEDGPGVSLLEETTLERIARAVRDVRRPGDRVVASIHWGGNWGYEISEEQREWAHGLIDEAGVDVVHGHSSHHPKGIEVHGGRPILYGCGDFLNDYEGIRSDHDAYRDELVLLYLATLDADSGALQRLEMLPFRLARLRLGRASPADAHWLRETLNRECHKLGTRVEAAEEDRFALSW